MTSPDLEIRRLHLALTEITAHLDAIEGRPHVMLRRAAEALGTGSLPENRSEDSFIGNFAAVLEKRTRVDR